MATFLEIFMAGEGNGGMDCSPWALLGTCHFLVPAFSKESLVALDLGLFSQFSLCLAKWLFFSPDTENEEVIVRLSCTPLPTISLE